MYPKTELHFSQTQFTMMLLGNFLIDYPVTGTDKKIVYLSKDGTTFQPNPIYNDLAKNFLIELLTTTTSIQKPPEGHVKEGGWGGNPDPITWSIESMQDEPSMFKIVDDKKVNIAHRFETQQKAQQYIDYYKSIFQKPHTTELPSGPTPALWTSQAWSNGNSRTLSAGNKDPDDDRMKLLHVGDPLPVAKIDGQGILTVTGGSPRVYYEGAWQNVEFSADVKANGNIEQSYLVARSNHEIRPEGFGGYDLYVDLSDKKIFFKKEICHELHNGMKGYSERLAEVEVDVKEADWFNQKVRITNVEGGKVLLEGFFNGEKKNEVIDDGSIKCGDEDGGLQMKETPQFTEAAKWCYTRVNSKGENVAGDISYRNVAIKTI